MNALADFKKSLGIKRVADISYETEDGTATFDDRSFSMATTPSPATAASGASSRRRMSSAASRGSRASRLSGISVQSELSPLYEEDDDTRVDEDDDTRVDEEDDTRVDDDQTEASPTPQKRRRLNTSLNHADSSVNTNRADSSVGSSITKNTSYNPGTVLEENEQESDDGEESEE